MTYVVVKHGQEGKTHTHKKDPTTTTTHTKKNYKNILRIAIEHALALQQPP